MLKSPALALGCGNLLCPGPNGSYCDGQGNKCWHYVYGPSCNMIGFNGCCAPEPACGGGPASSSARPSNNPTNNKTPKPTGSFGQAVPTPGGNTGNKKLDIVFVGAKYTDLNKFHQDVARYQDYITTTVPFANRLANLSLASIDNTQDLGCQRDNRIRRALICNPDTVVSVVNNAKVPYDIVLVIVDEDEAGGAALLGSNIVFVSRGAGQEKAAVHELGHTIGNLLDEYTLSQDQGSPATGQLDNQTHANCYAGQPPARKWQNLIGLNDYSKGCTNENWYRSSQDSIMRTLSAPYFNKISIDLLNKAIDFFTK